MDNLKFQIFEKLQNYFSMPNGHKFAKRRNTKNIIPVLLADYYNMKITISMQIFPQLPMFLFSRLFHGIYEYACLLRLPPS
jgi:hypothetical protein